MACEGFGVGDGVEARGRGCCITRSYRTDRGPRCYFGSMQVTLDIPDEVAERLVSAGRDIARRMRSKRSRWKAIAVKHAELSRKFKRIDGVWLTYAGS